MYVIVKYGNAWRAAGYIKDPKTAGVFASTSEHDSYCGQKCNLKPLYEDKKEAVRDCRKINEFNPVGDYAVCPVISEEEFSDVC